MEVWEVSETKLVGDVVGFYGPEFAATLQSPPSSTFVADGSPVTVRQGKRLDE